MLNTSSNLSVSLIVNRLFSFLTHIQICHVILLDNMYLIAFLGSFQILLNILTVLFNLLRERILFLNINCGPDITVCPSICLFENNLNPIHLVFSFLIFDASYLGSSHA